MSRDVHTHKGRSCFLWASNSRSVRRPFMPELFWFPAGDHAAIRKNPGGVIDRDLVAIAMPENVLAFLQAVFQILLKERRGFGTHDGSGHIINAHVEQY